MPEVALQTLDLVGRELNNTLGEARTALETFVEQPENVVLLQRCVSDLHQVQGVLRLLEIFGAALLAEEMEQVSLYLQTPASQKNQAETLDALMRAIVSDTRDTARRRPKCRETSSSSTRSKSALTQRGPRDRSVRG